MLLTKYLVGLFVVGLVFFVPSHSHCVDNTDDSKSTIEELEDQKVETDSLSIESEHGLMNVGLILQAGFEGYPNRLEGERNSFALQRARLQLDGYLISKNLRYLFTGDATAGVGLNIRQGAPGAEIYPDNSDTDVPFLLDARIDWHIPKIGLTISIGRFIPKWTLSMPHRVTRLGAINYPLYVYGAKNSPGPFRNVGAEVDIEIHPAVHAGGGIFNGGKNTWLDDNDRKDLMVYVSVAPIAGFSIRAASLFQFNEVFNGFDSLGNPIEHGQETHLTPSIETRFQDYGLDLMAGFAIDLAIRHDKDIRQDYESYGFLAHAGYLLLGDWLQLMARLEWWEPDNETTNDEQWRITVGPQLLIKDIHARLNINFIQDIFAGNRAMCETYLGLEDCNILSEIPEAQNNASTILLQLSLDI
jgi:hypothetical protein